MADAAHHDLLFIERSRWIQKEKKLLLRVTMSIAITGV